MNKEIIEKIDSLLPQTQCTRCGYQGCKPYAKALANNEADINQCPPGGDETINTLATLLNKSVKPLNPKFGAYHPPHIAIIIEKNCIGCAKCLAVCPVDAILGASKMMHTVIADECTGCERCISPCPVDCIVMEATEKKHNSLLAKQRYQARQQRLISLKKEQQERTNKKKAALIAMMKAKTVAKI
jgi:electron transport complex protein RnfB